MALTRKNSRKCYRKNRKDSRKNMRKSRRNRRQHGGSPMAQSLAQGRQFAEFHKNQHGGALMGAPLSEIDGSMLPQDLRSFARVGGLDESIAAAATQRDPDQVSVQQGGRRRNGRKSRKASRKNRKASRKNKKNSRKSSGKNSRRNRKQRGGSLSGAPYNQPTMLLSASAAAKAGTADFSNPLLKN